nr:transglycosylase SLT domain-containing protein [Roseococcus sp. MDT2-1-1]
MVPEAEARSSSQARERATHSERPAARDRADARQRRDSSSARLSARRTQVRRASPAPRPQTPELTRNRVLTAFVSAQQATGLSAEFLRLIAERESSLNPKARNRSSSATGLMQFTDDTWLEAVRDFGAQHGLRGYAALLRTDRDGNITTQDPRALRHILKLREDPRLSVAMAAERLRAARPRLEESLGRTVEPADLYLVHLLGVTGARRFLAAMRTDPNTTGVAVAGTAARSNINVFVRAGRPLSVAAVYEDIRQVFAPLRVTRV